MTHKSPAALFGMNVLRGLGENKIQQKKKKSIDLF